MVIQDVGSSLVISLELTAGQTPTINYRRNQSTSEISILLDTS
jgi:hypothetical protein